MKKIYESKRVHMSQFHSRFERISPSVTETFGMVRKNASIYEPKEKMLCSPLAQKLKMPSNEQCFMTFSPAAVA